MGNDESIFSSAPDAADAMSLFEKHDLILKSELFDYAFYIEKYRDITEGTDPLLHYLESGAGDHYDPNPQFDTELYLEQCREKGISTNNALLHYIMEGRALGIKAHRHEPDWSAPTDNSQWEMERLLESGLFDRSFYNQVYNFHFNTDQEALKHYFFVGYKEGKRPNQYFDSAWYLHNNPDVYHAGVQPLFHFLVSGDAESRRPSLIFDAPWYRKTYDIPAGKTTLAHFLENRTSCRFSPLPEFDVEHYASINRDVREAGVDPFEHFLFTGFREGRQPSRQFNIKYYANQYLGGKLTSNPFLHYLEHKSLAGVHGVPPSDAMNIARAVRNFTKPGPDFEEFKPIPKSAPKKAKVLAYYLPQFHAFPENDSWWGKGFTEWTNTSRGVSRFKGHYQPRVPRDLGYYSLDSVETIKQQVALAKGGGVHGFVFYYYWFNGKRLMDKPVELFLADSSIEMPFCLMWTNENWTRRWDGDDHQVLISQDYDPEDDERLIADFARHLSDPRYIRIAGRPLLMIYRPGLIPDCSRVISRWREKFKARFNENPILLMAQGFGSTDPAAFGLDGAIEFPPHKVAANLPQLNDQVEYLDPEFSGNIFSYDDMVARSVNEPMPSFPLIKTASPSWDNDARRQGSGMVMQGSTPDKYEAWLGELIKKTSEHPFFGERFVCVNAWNEWCEGAYLEPDLHFGSAYLNATSRAVVGVAAAPSECKLLLVGHDLFLHGAQYLLLNIARRLQSDFGVQIEFLLLSGGKEELEKAYRQAGPLTIVADKQLLPNFLDAARKRGFVSAIVNTTAAAHIIPELHARGIESVCLVHELPRLIRENGLQPGVRTAVEFARNIVFPSAVVRDQVLDEVGADINQRVVVSPQGTYKQLNPSTTAVTGIRSELKVAKGGKIVIGVGYADLRKGFDLFLQLWRQVNHSSDHPVHFCWVGGLDPGMRGWLATEIEDAELSGTFHLPGHRSDVDAFLFAADAFALTSREDPFPTVVHEALSAGLPVFVFEGSGGMPDFLAKHDMGIVVKHGDVIAMGLALKEVLQTPRNKLDAARRKEFVRTHLDFGDYVQGLMRMALPQMASISVAIPNYNYAQFMPQRLGTVFQQNYPISEILVLDDCSTDNSLEVIPNIAGEWNRKIKLLPNKKNSGSVFAQWRKAAQTATGEFLWIAEADDLSDARFLSTVVTAMQADPNICMGFSDSSAINYDGSPQAESYKWYFAQVEPGALTASTVFEGAEFASRYMSVRNLILNVSSVVWRREALLRALDACESELREFRMAGDWRLYIEALSAPGARIAYVADPLNVHRRHAESVTHALKAEKHIAEIARCHELAAAKLGLSVRSKNDQSKYLGEVSLQLLGKPAGREDAAKSSKRSVRIHQA